MLSLERCNEILKRHNFQIDNENLKMLRDFLYSIASLQIQNENKDTELIGNE